MKRILVFAICFFLIFGACALPSSAQEERYQWYCKHVKGHLQPPLDTELSFVEELGGYYLDRSCKDPFAGEKVIYLTFDVGYENGNVAKTLDVLKEEGVCAAFFILGHLVTHDTELVKRMTDEGHTVCNHTARHKDMSAFKDEDFLEELHALEKLYREHTGYEMAPFYRPPEGKFSRSNLGCAMQNGYKTVFWSFAYPDWDNERQMSPEKAKQIILDNTHNGEIMLLHPTSSTNAQILGDIIQQLKSEGYRFATLDELGT